MKPYKHIKFILRPLIRDALQVDFEYYSFDENDARWKLSIENPQERYHDISWGNQYCNIIKSRNEVGADLFPGRGADLAERDIEWAEWYSYNNKKWMPINWKSEKIFDSVLDHSFEPVWYDLDLTLWDRKYYRFHPWPGHAVKGNDSTFLEVKDLPIYVLHSEHNSKDIQKLDELGYRTVHWFSHAFLCSEYYFKMYSNLDIVKNYTARPIRSPWICANRLIRQHRTDFLEMLDLSKGCYSFLNPDPNGLTYAGPIPTHSFDVHENHSAEINVEELTPWNTSFLHIVSETVWQEKIHFTEKVFKPIVLHQPFVVLQAPNSLMYLRSYGFRTFGNWWDESYDTIEDPQERMQAIADIVNSIGNKSIEELETMRMEMASVLEHNFRHFYENIPAICLNELSVGFTLTP